MSWPMTCRDCKPGIATTSAKAAPITATRGDSWSGTMPRTSYALTNSARVGTGATLAVGAGAADLKNRAGCVGTHRRPASTAPDSASARAWSLASPRASPRVAPAPRAPDVALGGRWARGAACPHARRRRGPTDRQVRAPARSTRAHAHDLPAARGGHVFGVLAAQVVGVRLGVGRERTEHDGPIGVGVGRASRPRGAAPRLEHPRVRPTPGTLVVPGDDTEAPRRSAGAGSLE